MGTTIKRQPINFKIPNAPDYKYLNITDFKGIVETENPLDVPQNTASDCLNVYVDDDGVLSTRPRLETSFNLKQGLLKDLEISNVYKLLDDSLLIQAKNDKSVLLFVLKENALTRVEIEPEIIITENKLNVFEHENKIYFVDGNGYYVIKDLVNGVPRIYNVMNDEDTYIPTTHTGIIVSGEKQLTKIAEENLLTNKYRVDYFWDGVSDINDVLNDEGVLIKNDYIHKTKTKPSSSYDENTPARPVTITKDDRILLGGSIYSSESEYNSSIIIYPGVSSLPDYPNLSAIKIKGTDKQLHVGDRLINDSNDVADVVSSDYDKTVPDSYNTYTIVTKPNSSYVVDVETTVNIPIRIWGDKNKQIIGKITNDVFSPIHELTSYKQTVFSKNLTTLAEGFDRIPEGIFLYDIDNNIKRFFYNTTTGTVLWNVDLNQRNFIVLENAIGFICVNAFGFSEDNNKKWKIDKVLWSDSKQSFETTTIYNNQSAGEYSDVTYSNVELLYDEQADTLIATIPQLRPLSTADIIMFKDIKNNTTNKKVYGGPANFFENDMLFYVSSSSSHSTMTYYNSQETDASGNLVENKIVFPKTIQGYSVDTNKKQVFVITSEGIHASSVRTVYLYDIVKKQHYKLYDLLPNEKMEDFKDNRFTDDIISYNGRIVVTKADYDYDFYMGEYGFREFIFNFIKTSSEPLITKEYTKSQSSSIDHTLHTKDSILNIYNEETGTSSLITVDFTGKELQQALMYIYSKTSGEELSFPVDIILDGEVHVGSAGSNDYSYQYLNGILKIGNGYRGSMMLVSPSGFQKIRLRSVYTEVPETESEFNETFDSLAFFQNKLWFYNNTNRLRWSDTNHPTYLRQYDYADLGDYSRITDTVITAYDTMLVFKNNGFFVVNPVIINEKETFTFNENKTDNGVSFMHTALISPLNEIPLFFNKNGIYTTKYLTNVQTDEQNTVLLSDDMRKKYSNNISDFVITNKYKNWVLMLNVGEKTNVFVLDDKNNTWFYWTFPIKTLSTWIKDDKFFMCDVDGMVYELKTSDKIHEFNTQLTEYFDDINGEKINIPWYWKSQILHLNTINHSKRLLDTTFILNDTDDTDEYGFDYCFKAFRRNVSDSSPITLAGSLNFIRSVTKRTPVSRFSFVQILLSNSAEDVNNKLRLSGLSLKYELLGGLLL